ncbi:50S ribosomal protein L18a [Salinigranum rubrum]|uniref:Large ribosomal subunit protein eL20 n=1 Tax=Salinigranum rubrum TaxID=755307 RepID=A0A2I8VNV7_9EURY|nr:50S ribosomal protein L18Ae [Salinigranum rubrum]AUV83603.1 50S ribosomal protein L18a [Salinigranum rubrum]
MSQFTVSGRFRTRHGLQEFTKSIDAPNESVAREHVLSQLGSEHNLKRTRIELGEVTAA